MGWLTHEINDPRTRARIEQTLIRPALYEEDARRRTLAGSVTLGGQASDKAADAQTEKRRSLPSPPESDLHDYILDWWHERGWLAIHSRMDQRTTTAKGVADFILICPRTVLFVECKRPGKKPTPEQREFLAHVKKMGWPNAVVTSREGFHQFIEPIT